MSEWKNNWKIVSLNGKEEIEASVMTIKWKNDKKIGTKELMKSWVMDGMKEKRQENFNEKYNLKSIRP